MDLAALSRLIENLIRMGTIHSVDYDIARCRVQSGNLVTQWLPWFSARAGETSTWDPPTVGEQCIVLSPSGETAAGLVFYGTYSDAHPAPSASPVKHLIRFADGACIEYDHAAHHLDVSGVQTAAIHAAVSITLDTPLTHCTGSLTVDDLLTYGNGIAGTGGANKNIISGDFNHTGGNLSSNGKVLHTHTHTGVIPGGGNTGGPA